jgi:hypothetical protein
MAILIGPLRDDGKHDRWGREVDRSTGQEKDQRSVANGHTTEIAVVNEEETEDPLGDDGYTTTSILKRSSHRDGSMYRGIRIPRNCWKKMFDVVDRSESETQFEAMTFSDPTPDCSSWDGGSCWKHHPIGMVQIFAVNVARIPADAGSVELYGYIAARDELDPRLNYVVDISRDDPIVVEQGSLISMAGPKRGIIMMDNTFVEYDMRIKRGEREQDDLQVLDGASILSFNGSWNYPFKLDTPGE